MKKEYPNVKLSEIVDVIMEEAAYQLHKKPRTTVKAHMVAFRKNQIWLADFVDMSNYSRDNHGFKWILLVIDVFTRRAFGEPMKSKEAANVLRAFKKIVKDQYRTDCLSSPSSHPPPHQMSPSKVHCAIIGYPPYYCAYDASHSIQC